MLRFIILMLIAASSIVQAQDQIDLELVKQVQEFAEDVNKNLPINPAFKDQEQNEQQFTGPRLIVFISTSMPEKSIKQWAKQADLLGAELVIRGFVNNSFKETIILAQQLFGSDKVGGFNIDPFKFKQYAIEGVPTVVLDVSGNIDTVSGDIGLIEALKVMQAKGINSKDAKKYLSQI